MEGTSRTVRYSDDLAKTNFNDWSDPKQKKLPHRPERPRERKSTHETHGESYLHSTESDTSDNLLKPVLSKTTIEINSIKEKIRKGQPLMSKKEIREFRLPFHESLLLNLEEDGFLLTYEFIKDLIAIDDAYHKEVAINLNLKKRPLLKCTQSALVPLTKGLIKAETSKLNDDKNQELKAFLDLAILFSRTDNPSWNWIALEMFEQCIEVIGTVESVVNPELRARAKYLYASFLFNEMHELNEARNQIEHSMLISEGKNWTTEDAKGKKGDTLYNESCILLHKIFLEMAQREMLNDNPEEAIQFCRSSLLWAKMLNNKLAEVAALRELINIYLSSQQLFSVPEIIETYMKLCSELENVESICEGYIMYARYHDRIGEDASVIEDMTNLLKIAKEHSITKMIAMAHHKLATFCLTKGSEKELLEHAIEAYMSYLNLKHSHASETEEARCLVGVAQAQEIMTDFCSLASEAENYNTVEQLVLFRWKNLRIPFFDKQLVLIPEMSQNSDLLDRVEFKKAEDKLAALTRIQSEAVSLSYRNTMDYLALPNRQTVRNTIDIFNSSNRFTTTTELKPYSLNKSYSTDNYRRSKDTMMLRKSLAVSTLGDYKTRTVSFMNKEHK